MTNLIVCSCFSVPKNGIEHVLKYRDFGRNSKYRLFFFFLKELFKRFWGFSWLGIFFLEGGGGFL